MLLELAELDGIIQIRIRQLLVSGKVGHGAGNTQDAVKSTGGERQLAHGRKQHFLLRRRQRAVFSELLAAEAGIAGDARSGIAAALALPRCHDPLQYGGAALAIRFAQQISRIHRGNLDENIKTVQQGAGNLLPIARHLCRTAAAGMPWVTQITAGARVHRRHQLFMQLQARALQCPNAHLLKLVMSV